MNKKDYSYEDLLEIMKILRSPQGCPWDREQDHESLKKYLIEETYEVIEAIDMKNPEKLCEELGDVLLQVVFHSRIAEENGQFSMNDVIQTVSEKMVHRHKHVFGLEQAETADDVIDLWEKIKKEEKGYKNHTSVLDGVPSVLPALMRSYKIQQKAAKVGFDWDNIDDAWKKVAEEAGELREAYMSGDLAKSEEEVGDLLFAVVNIARFLKIEPELALTGTIDKFIRRFEYIEKRSTEMGRELTGMTLAEMDQLWDEAKKNF